MGESIIVAPAVVVMVTTIRGNEFFDQFFSVLNQARFMLDGSEGRRRTGDEKRSCAGAEICPLNVFSEFCGKVNYVAEAGCGFVNFLGFDRDHAAFYGYQL